MATADLQTLKERLAHHGLKATSQRLAIYHDMLTHHDHPTAELILERIKPVQPGVSLATVYKTIDALVEAGLAKKVKTAGDVLRFDAKTDAHNHLYCTNTDQIIDFEDVELEELLGQYFSRKKFSNFKITDFQLQVSGEIVNRDKEIKLKQSK